MPELVVVIGDVAFDVACKEGEESYLKTAAAMLDAEASALKQALGRIPENRMLLMAGLMLADKTASLEDEIKKRSADPDEGVKKRLAQAETVLQDTLAELSTLKAAAPEQQNMMQAAKTKIAELETALSANKDDAIEDMQEKITLLEQQLHKAQKHRDQFSTERDEAVQTASTIVEMLTQTAVDLEQSNA